LSLFFEKFPGDPLLRSSFHKIKAEINSVNYFLQILTIPGQSQHAIPWWQSRKPNYLIASPMPWICFDAITFLTNWVKSKENLNVFEYGSGGSTFFWMLFDVRLISIEHDFSWFTKIKSELHERKLDTVDYRFVEPEYKNENWWKERDPSDPFQYSTGDENLKNFTFQNYVKQIEPFPDHYFDLIMIDGRSRPACIAHSVNKVKPGGLLVIDNSDIKYYFQKTASYLKTFDQIVFSGVGPALTHTWNTDIFLAK
jgi:hypothetical protein